MKITLDYGKGVQYTGTFKDSTQINYCPIGKVVQLGFDDESNYTGIFNGIEDETIMLKSIKSGTVVGLPLNRLLNTYFQQD